MGKKTKRLKVLGGKVSQPGPLADQIKEDEVAQKKERVKMRGHVTEEEEYVEGRTILKQSKALLQEMETEELFKDDDFPALGAPRPWQVKPTPVSLKPKKDSDDEDSSEEEEIDETEDAIPISCDKATQELEQELGLTEDDKNVLEHFMNKDAAPQRKLADLFKERITEKQSEIQSQVDATSVQTMNLSPEVQEMCREVGKVLAKYRSGPLPKMFKVIPKMKSWEELVYLTHPDRWSAAATYQAVRIFVSNLKEAMAQRFFNLVLLPRIRDDISCYKRLNFHLYQALYKAMFKPAAFFKGILLPLCMAGNCTLREAIIIGSVISKCHIPILHSAAAILKIAEMDYTGPNSIFLRIFFDKKYALPYRVVDACVYHFIKFENDKRELPVLWHQSLLTFVQRYKEDLSPDQKQSLLDVVRFHTHHTVTPEVRRELMNSKCRGQDDEAMFVE